MKSCLFIIILLVSCNIIYSQTVSDSNIVVNDSLINSIMKYDYANDTKYIVSNLVNLLYRDTDATADLKEIEYQFTPIIANLDEDAYPEIIALIEENYYHAMIILKEMDLNWYVIYYTNFSNDNYDPGIEIVNNPSRNKLFYLKYLRGRGSGVYDDGYSFYKIINKKVYNCLDVLHEAYIDGWGLYLNQEANANFQISSIGEDFIWVNYKYEFYAGPSLLSDTSDYDSKLTILKGDESVGYYWNDSTCKYVPQYNEKLNDKKINCFETFGNDSLFVDAFKEDLNEKLKKGSKVEKEMIQKYLSSYKIKQ